MSQQGHNSAQAFFDRLLNLETQKRDLLSDIADLKKEMNSTGEDAAAMVQAVQDTFRKATAKAKRKRTEEMLDLYRQQFGTF
jgi:uncharacterized protein (UPF0335 family)